MEWKIFKAYDIRGVYPTEVNESGYYRIAKGYAYVFRPNQVVVGMDARLSSASLKDSLISGLLDVGVNVIDIGQITTDMLYFAVGKYGFSGGITVSASHNPREYNGLKIVRENAKAVSSDTGLLEIRNVIMEKKDEKISPRKKGTYERKEILEDYINHVMSFIDTSVIKKFTIVANTNFGYTCKTVQMIADKLNLKIIPLNFEPDGSFPKGQPDPLLTENRFETEKTVRDSKADFGVAWDGDGDRVMFFDENGRFIFGVYMGALFAKLMLKKYGSANKVIYDTRVIWPILKAVKENGGYPIMSKAGHAFIKDRMVLEDALFGAELSAHYFFRDNFYADNGIIPFLILIEYLSRENKTLAKIVNPFMQEHYMSGELNYRVEKPEEIIKNLQKRFGKEGKEDFTDLYSVETESWRFNIRPSNTEPLIRLNIEARNKDLIEKIKKEIEKIING
jgi:phosphomannomutase